MPVVKWWAASALQETGNLIVPSLWSSWAKAAGARSARAMAPRLGAVLGMTGLLGKTGRTPRCTRQGHPSIEGEIFTFVGVRLRRQRTTADSPALRGGRKSRWAHLDIQSESYDSFVSIGILYLARSAGSRCHAG